MEKSKERGAEQTIAEPAQETDRQGYLPVARFLTSSAPLLDVRSPAEYRHAHLPGALNWPLFSDEERAQVGLCYKQEGHERALRLGLELVGPRMGQLLQQGCALLQGATQARIYCWRGGLRSRAMGELLRWKGVELELLKGGYKAFRRWAIARLAEPPPLRLLGGMTGAGKSQLLRDWRKQGLPVVDLEELAVHRGSLFGACAVAQPSCEQFENQLACQLDSFSSQAPIWLEDESRFIGRCQLPAPLFTAMQKAPLWSLECCSEERIERLIAEYGQQPKQKLQQNLLALQKRLGGERIQQALESLEREELAEVVRLVLPYYDRSYERSLGRRPGPTYLLPRGANPWTL